ncbi:MAG: carboxypeptidase-like regulatory domain-containing protein [Janthinobacterium lividum]
MQRLCFLVFLLALVATSARAQLIKGRVSDVKTGQPLPFVNIGVVGKALGTVTNEQGQYQLTFQESLAADTVRISYLGYQALKLPLRQLSAQPNVLLSSAPVSLSEVQVSAKNAFRRARTLGFTGNSETATLTINSKDLGAEIGTVINLKHKPTKVLTTNFNVAYNRVGKFTFRVNLYRLGADGKPTDEKLLRREIVVNTEVAKGPITIDLTPDKLILDEDFFLAVEWIGGADAAALQKGLAFSAGLGYANNDIYYRAVSQDTWQRLSAGAVLAGMQPKLSFFVTAQD